MFIKELYKKYRFCVEADRLGPDMIFNHWRLYFQSTMKVLCRKKFKRFGHNTDFRPGAYAVFCSNIELGDNVVIRPSTMIFADEFSSVIIEDDVMIGAGVHFYVNNHKFDCKNTPVIEQGYYSSEDIIIKKGAWVGANSIILPGVTIGYNSVVGAGSVVTKPVPNGVVVVGSPARVIK